MALRDLLYRCPRCGHDPTGGRGDEARCRRCHTVYRRRGGRITAGTDPAERARPAPGPTAAPAVPPSHAGTPIPPLPEAWREGVPATALVDALDRLGGPLGAATGRDGSIRYETRALHHGVLQEEPVRHGGRLLGFMERPAPGREGVLRATEEALSFRFADDGREEILDLDDVTALQLASRALQVGVTGGGTLQWTLLEDSPFRWETLLQDLLRRRWRAGGRGEIVEFQPRIVAP